MEQADILRGVRVIDFARYIAGPYCATLLGYLGADVIRVEKPGGGEDRYVVPLTTPDGGAIFVYIGSNKRSMTLDLKHADAPAVVRRLVAGADCVVINQTPAGLESLGLDYETLRQIKPDIILTTQTAYGHEGPWANRGGFDGVAQAMSGATQMSGRPGEPAKALAPYVDFGTALYGAFATLAALYSRRETGHGQHIQASLLGTAVAFMGSSLTEQAALTRNRVPTGNRSQTSGPSDIFATRDGHVLIHVVAGGLFRRIATVVGAPEWLDDPRLTTDIDRGEHRDELCGRVAEWCAAQSTTEVTQALAAAGVPCGPVLSLAEALQHPQIAAMGLLQTLPFGDAQETVQVPDFPVDMSESTVGVHRGAPRLGEHTDEILREIGYSSQEIEQLRAGGAI